MTIVDDAVAPYVPMRSTPSWAKSTSPIFIDELIDLLKLMEAVRQRGPGQQQGLPRPANQWQTQAQRRAAG
jgi:hypothetical protein